jgi:hypothetical protein
MRHRIWLSAAAFLLVTGSLAFADDKSQCEAGIKAIKAAIAKKPAQPVLDRLKRALDSAQQEEFERDWDECVDAIKEAKLPKRSR